MEKKYFNIRSSYDLKGKFTLSFIKAEVMAYLLFQFIQDFQFQLLSFCEWHYVCVLTKGTASFSCLPS